MIELGQHQLDAIEKLKNGSILCGDVGTGKSRTALAYYYIKVCGGGLKINGKGTYHGMAEPRDIYIITTAKKRDDHDWEEEAIPFRVSTDPTLSYDSVKLTIDSWNNIKKYTKVYGAFFIFDEQRVVGYGAWTKAFLDIARKNKWILLSATPGDTWSDYIPVFIANGFYRNKTDFAYRHIVYSRVTKYPKIERYVDTGILVRHRNDILVRMKFERKTTRERHVVYTDYDKQLYLTVWKKRWDPYDDCPIEETGKLFYLMRKVVNNDESRLAAVERIAEMHKRLIVFYNFTYELENLRRLFTRLNFAIGEWNGEVHSDIPSGTEWVYLVQYSAGCEGWNCITTDTIIFYSQSYSYRMTVQAEGRIDRLNTSYKTLYYYILKSHAPIDLAIARALASKHNFNERAYIGS